MHLRFLFLIIAILSSCSTTKHVSVGPDGINSFVLKGARKSIVETKAMEEAKNFCAEKKLVPAFISTEITEKSESYDSRHTPSVTKAATSVLGVMGTYQRPDEEAFTADIKFKCI